MSGSAWRWAGAAAVLLLLALLVLRPAPQDAGVTAPWQIEMTGGGGSRVFGITLGASTLGEARAALGDDMELAVIAASGEPGSLEAYYARITAGPVIGRIVLDAQADADTLRRLQANSPRLDRAGTGARKMRIASDDLSEALSARVVGIVFLPVVNLDEDVVVARFGAPAQRVRSDAHTEHFLYPDKGLDVVLSDQEREVLQYVAPRDFQRLAAPLQGAARD